MGKAIGIDLGTTNTAVAVILDGRPRVLEDEKGYKVLPSCVSLKADEGFLVGQAAKNLILTKANRSVFAIKRLMGRRFDSPEVAEVRKIVGYAIAQADDGTCKVRMGDRWFTPVEVSAEILKVARAMAERALGEKVDDAVITVPAYFNHAQRAATLQAAQLAGLRCERLLNEPTAAALAYGFRKDVERSILVYDLGGGTFDVSVLRLSHGIYEVLSTSGDTHLGGEDFDHRIVDHLAEGFQAGTGVDLRTDPTALQRLRDAAERAKCELSFTDRTTVLIPRITMADNLEQALSRLALEGLVEPMVQRTLEITRRAVTDAGLRISDIDDVILVGGQTRMPRVREAIAALFQKEPSRSVHPEEVVAIGAAVQASSLVQDAAPGHLLLDVTPFTLGIDVVGGLFQPLIQRNTQVPATATQIFSTARDNQRQVKVTVRQGDDQLSQKNEFLGEFVMGGLTPAPRMQTKVEVSFRLDVNGMLHVAALEQGSGERKRITIRNYAEFVKSEGGVSAEVEGDVGPAPESPGEAARSSGGAEPTKKDQGGFLRRLFGKPSGGKEPATDPRPPAPAAAPGDRSAEPAPSAIPEMPAFLAELEPLEALEPLPLGADALEGLEPLAGLDPLVGGLEPLDLVEPLELEPAGRGAEAFALPDGDDADSPDDYADDYGDLSEPLEEGPEDECFALDDGDGELDGEGEPEDALDALDADALDADALDAELAEALAAAAAAAGGDGDDDAAEPAFGWGPAPEPTEEAPPEAGSGAWAHGGPGDPWAAVARPPTPPPEADDELEADDDGMVVFTRAPPALPRRPASANDWRAADDLDPEEEPTGDFGSFEPGLLVGVASLEGATPGPIPVEPYDDEPTDPPRPAPPRGRGPARLKLAYRRADALVAEQRDNLRRGGCFVRSEKPLRVGRDCVIELRAPGLDGALQVPGQVTWSSADQPTLAPGQEPGMGIEYRLSGAERAAFEGALRALGG